MLHLFLFGTPRIEFGGQSIPLRRTKALALLAYLAVMVQPQDRDALLALLWPEFDELSARNNLRRELSRLKSALGQEFLVADRRQVRWNGQLVSWLDLAAFQAQLAVGKQHGHASGQLCAECAAALMTAAQLYTDDFLAGFSLPDSPTFDEWQFFQRESLRQQLAEVLQSLISWYRRAEDYAAAIAYARRWLALDPLHEPAQRELMRLYAWSGQPSAALRQYAEGLRILDKELGAEPEAETTDLYEAIKTRRFALPSATSASARSAAVVERHTAEPPTPMPQPRIDILLPQPTPFIGRESELRELAGLLADPACRLLSLVGPGGVGKTRLAIELAQRQRAAFADGCCFVELHAVDTATLLISSIAESLQRPLIGSESLRDQLLAALVPRQLLLILDNFDDLLEGTDLLSAICTAAPGVTLLVTSREALNVQEEWRYPLTGLDIPVARHPQHIASCSSVQLFVERARRVRHSFVIEAEQDAVARICQLVAGVPLAVELAATWTATLSCSDIAAEIERNIAFLTASMRNLPERHRSMRAVFDHSWQRLDEQQRAIFMRLSIFRGSFTRQAAAAIAGATITDLAALVDKSLVRRNDQARYQLHEVLRQFAELHLQKTPVEAARVQDAYAAYYARFLGDLWTARLRGDAPAAIAAVVTELENLRAAWPLIAERTDDIALRHAARMLYFFYLVRGPYQEGMAALEYAVSELRDTDATEQRQLTLALLLVDLAWLAIRLGQVHRARSLLEESAEIYTRLAVPPLPDFSTDPQIGLAVITLIQGQYAEAARLGEAIRLRCEADQDQWNLPYAWYVLTQAALAQGQCATAQRCARQAYQGAMALGNRWFAAYCLIDLGTAACGLGAYDAARQHYQAGYAIREQFDDGQGMALALNLLGKVARLQADYPEARSLHQRSLEIYQAIGDRGGVATALSGLGTLNCHREDYAAARRCFLEALGIAAEMQFVPLQLTILTAIAGYWGDVNWPELGLEILMLVLRHPATDREAFQQAQELLLEFEVHVAPEVVEVAGQRDQSAELDMIVRRMLVELTTPPSPVARVSDPPSDLSG